MEPEEEEESVSFVCFLCHEDLRDMHVHTMAEFQQTVAEGGAPA